MAGISSYDSASMSILLSSLNTNSSKSASSGAMDYLGINYSDYASIRSGAYHKLLSAYYEDGKSIKGVTDSISTSKDDAKTLTQIESAAEGMKDSADKLLTTGKQSLFNEVTTKGEDGKTTTGYDTDAIYKAVNDFVDDYNTLVDKAADSNSTNILRAAKTMVNYSKVNQKLLAAVGITIGAENKLSIDEKTFKEADMKKVKSLFQERGSYGYQIMTQASMIDTYAKNEASKANTYGKSGMYTYNYSTGELYNSRT